MGGQKLTHFKTSFAQKNVPIMKGSFDGDINLNQYCIEITHYLLPFIKMAYLRIGCISASAIVYIKRMYLEILHQRKQRIPDPF